MCFIWFVIDQTEDTHIETDFHQIYEETELPNSYIKDKYKSDIGKILSNTLTSMA